MSDFYSGILVSVMALMTFLIRALPFLIFRNNEKLPPALIYLGDVLPSAAIGMLVIYCLRNIEFPASPFGLPELLSCLLVVVLQAYKRNSILSILCGTVCYMILIQIVFA